MTTPINLTTPPEIAKILSDANMEPVPYGARHQALADNLGLDLREVIEITKSIPLMLRGADHEESRKRMAVLIAQAAPRVRIVTQQRLPAMIAALMSPGPHDVMAEFVDPLVNTIMAAIVGIDIDLAADSMVSRLFSQSIGVSKRRRMNSELVALRQQIATKLPDLTPAEVSDRMTLCILGMDALRGTLGCSLHDIFRSGIWAAPDPLTRAYPPRTGVPYIDREAVSPVVVHDENHAAGTNFRAWLVKLEDVDDSEARKRFFGFGAHTCLGRKLSLEIWEGMTAALHLHPATIETLNYALRRDDVFHVPEKFVIEVTRVENSHSGH